MANGGNSILPRDPDVHRAVSVLLDELYGSGVASYKKWHELLQSSSGIDGNKELFAVQTYFAGLIKQTAFQQIGIKLSDPFFSWADFMTAGSKPVWHDKGRHRSLPRGENCESKWVRGYGTATTPPAVDLFGPAYQKFFSAATRKALGEFYTPDWLADYLVGILDDEDTPLLDPCCGSGVFLLSAIRKFSRYNTPVDTILQKIRGFDLNPLAVLMAKANIALALGITDEKSIPVFQRDSLLDSPLPEEAERYRLVGNPPWLNWDRLPREYREKTKPLWNRYGLFNLPGNEARHGGAKKELAQLIILRVADRYLRPGGKLAMLLPISVFQTKKAGEGFRRFRLPDDTPLGIVQVEDFSAMQKQPFGNVGTKAGAIVLTKDSETIFPVTFRRWPDTSGDSVKKMIAIPSEKNAASPWRVFLSTQSDTGDGTAYRHLVPTLRKSDYRAFLGANTGGANGVFWVELLGPVPLSPHLVRIRNLPRCGKLPLPAIEAVVEEELVYPLLCWGDVERGGIRKPSRFILLPQDLAHRCGLPEELMRERFPFAFEYLRHFEQPLRERAAFKKYQTHAPFYSMYNVGLQTVAEIKTVWRRMDRMLRAVAIEPLDHPLLGRRPIVPQETCVLIPCQSMPEARYVAEALNSTRVAEIIQSVTVPGSKGFGSPGILDYLGIRSFSENAAGNASNFDLDGVE